MTLILSFVELERSWRPVRHTGTLFVNLLFLVIFVTLAFVSIHQKFLFVPPDHFGEAVDLKCEVQSSRERQANLQTINKSFAVLNIQTMNSAISLNKSQIYKSLSLAKSLDDVNQFVRPSSTQGESTSEELTQSDEFERFQFDEEMDMLMQNLDSQKLRINPSPTSGDSFWKN